MSHAISALINRQGALVIVRIEAYWNYTSMVAVQLKIIDFGNLRSVGCKNVISELLCQQQNCVSNAISKNTEQEVTWSEKMEWNVIDSKMWKALCWKILQTQTFSAKKVQGSQSHTATYRLLRSPVPAWCTVADSAVTSATWKQHWVKNPMLYASDEAPDSSGCKTKNTWTGGKCIASPFPVHTCCCGFSLPKDMMVAPVVFTSVRLFFQSYQGARSFG